MKFATIQAMQRYAGGCVSTEKENNKLFEKEQNRTEQICYYFQTKS